MINSTLKYFCSLNTVVQTKYIIQTKYIAILYYILMCLIFVKKFTSLPKVDRYTNIP